MSSTPLPLNFLLTDYTQLKGCSCKLPQSKLMQLLQAGYAEDENSSSSSSSSGSAAAAAVQQEKPSDASVMACSRPGTGDDVGMDCSIEELSYPGPGGEKLYMVSSTDFFSPSIEDPFLQGAVGAANVVSDLCSFGIDKPDTVLCILASSTDMDEPERTTVSAQMLRGFNAAIRRCGGARVTGGHSIYNPWPLIGGTAMAVVPESGFIRPTNLRKGDILVLTKPLGAQLGVNLRHWSQRPTRLFEQFIKGKMTQEEIDKLYDLTVKCMARLNVNGAKMMRKYKSSGGTDITGFGILGHSKNLGAAQPGKDLKVEIHTLPMLSGAVKADTLLQGHYKLLKGLSAETSGGLLFAVESMAAAEAVAKELTEEFGEKAWIVGSVTERKEGEVPALLAPDCKVVEVAEL